MSCGIFLIDKETGPSSAAVVSKLKKKFELERVGHAGTLDPMASGLLVCLCGTATRLANFAQGGAKVYSGFIQFGLTTTTDDITGEELSRSQSLPDFEDVKGAVHEFTGVITQAPPRISAVKVNGQRAYRRARRGEDFQLTGREVEVMSFEVSPTCDPSIISFRVRCSKGTYIRSLARDLGERLECGGCLASLRRESTDPFSVENARKLEEVDRADLLPWDILFPNCARLEVSEAEARRLLNGERTVLAGLSPRLPRQPSEAKIAVYGTQRPLGLLQRNGEAWDFAINVG